MTKSVNERELVLEILLEITRGDVYSHIALRQVLEKYQYLDKKERAFITRVVEGTLEHQIELDYIINQFSKVKVKKMKPVIRTIIRSAVYQLKYMDSVPNSAVCNEAVKLAVKKGFQGLRGFVNGVLRSIDRNLDQVVYPAKESDLKQYLSVRYSMPEWIIEQWLPVYGAEVTEKMLNDFQTEKPTVIRCNETKLSVEELTAALQAEGVTVERHPYLEYALCISHYDYLGGLASFQTGDFYVQDISSMLVCEITAPGPKDDIIDVCAAPGGKSLHLAQKLTAGGHVEARDLTEYKVSMIEENIARSGQLNISAKQQDATILDLDSVQSADVVIADIPCSGLGVLGKKTDLKYKFSPEMCAELVALQRRILTVVREYVKPGGTLVYSTCTVNPQENIENVHWFLENYPEFELADITENLCDELKSAVSQQGCLQLLPGIHKCDGFFIAKFHQKKR
ncbi:MAG: 16S rRNA (cytosine(967)-C(5))-methyltransferase RsmB [Hespellia sp.]|nr:16S rRNA (cytosine(967)-C(5))-methyltransferase RsmB [Hespellia sp.]